MELSTAARPYAKALFQLALDEGRLPAWSQTLALLTQCVQIPEVAQVVGHPALTHQQLAALLSSALAGKLDGEGENLLRLLSENRRLKLLPLIHEEFEAFKAAAERRAEVEITTAVPVSDEQRSTLSDAVKRRIGLEVHTSWLENPALIAGAVVRSGDLVIDGSVSGDLERLRHALAA